MQTHAEQPQDFRSMPSVRHAQSTRAGPLVPRASHLLYLQRWAGNRAVASRFGSAPAVQREDTKPTSLAEAMKGTDPDALIPFRPFPALSPGQVHTICRLVIDNNRWVGPDNELSLESAWSAVAGQRAALKEEDWNLWAECEGYGADVKAVPWMREMRTSFADRVRATAVRNVESNITSITNESKRLGIATDGSSQPAPTPESDEAVKKQQELARLIEDAHAKQKQLRDIPVGYGDPSWGPSYNGKAPLPPGGRAEEIEPPKIATFNPESPPPCRSDPDPNPAAGIAKHEVVKAIHDEITLSVAGILNENPALYAIAARGSTASIVGQDIASTRGQMANALQDVLANATKTRGEITSRSLHFTDLLPAIDAVREEAQYQTGFANKLVENYLTEEREAAGNADKLISLLTIALITAVEVGSGGTATPVVAALISLAASAGTAAASWNEWDKLETAAKSTVSDKNAIVTQETADTAQITALISTAVALMDVYGLGKASRAASTGSRAAVTALEDRVSDVAKLKQLAQGAAVADAREVVERSLTSFGPAMTVRNVGSWQKLTATLGAGSPAMGTLSSWRNGVFRAAEEAGMKAAAGEEGEAARAMLALASGIGQAALGEALDAVIEVFAGDATGDAGHIAGGYGTAEVDLRAVTELTIRQHPATQAVQRTPIEIVTLPISELKLMAMSGDEFEAVIRRYVAAGNFTALGLPRMTVLDAKVHGGGHGFDGLGISKQGDLIQLYNIECKFVAPGSAYEPTLKMTSGGLQGSADWNKFTARRILAGAHPEADETLEAIARAVRQRRGYFDERILDSALVAACKNAKPYVITPVWAKADILGQQVRSIGGKLIRVAARRR
jgi:hypothetical protein